MWKNRAASTPGLQASLGAILWSSTRNRVIPSEVILAKEIASVSSQSQVWLQVTKAHSKPGWTSFYNSLCLLGLSPAVRLFHPQMGTKSAGGETWVSHNSSGIFCTHLVATWMYLTRPSMSTWFCLRASTCIYIIYIKLHIGVVQLRARCRVNTISSLNIDIYIYIWELIMIWYRCIHTRIEKYTIYLKGKKDTVLAKVFQRIGIEVDWYVFVYCIRI